MSWPTWYIDMGRPIAWKMCKGSNPAFMLWRIWHWLISWLWLKNIENSISVLSLPLVKVNSTSTFWWKYYGSIEKIGVHMHHITWAKGEKKGCSGKKGMCHSAGCGFYLPESGTGSTNSNFCLLEQGTYFSPIPTLKLGLLFSCQDQGVNKCYSHLISVACLLKHATSDLWSTASLFDH